MPSSYPLISPESLAAALDAGTRIRLVDASFALPGSGDDARAAFARERLPGAVFFDIDAIADKATALPHMLPAPEAFGAAASALGLSNGDRIVIYGQSGIAMGPARVWWTLRVFGHDDVLVLDGGLPAWKALGLPLETGPAAAVPPGRFRAGFRAGLVCDAEAVAQALRGGGAVVLDARTLGRFTGAEPEPRPGLRAGHMPGSVCLPCGQLIDPATGRMKSRDALEALFRGAGVQPGKPVIASCGSGVTACVLALGLAAIGWPDAAIYDGSWAEWGQEAGGRPVERSGERSAINS